MPWQCLCGCGQAGVLDDPGTSIAAVAAAVHTGRLTHRARTDLAAALDSRLDPASVARREQEIRRLDGACPVAESAVLRFRELALDSWLEDLVEPVVVGVGAALLVPARRDALIEWTAAVTEPGVATAAWARLVQELPGTARATAATLCAVAALLDGDGAMANVALDLVERIHPRLDIAALVARVAARGIPPRALRELILGRRAT